MEPLNLDRAPVVLELDVPVEKILSVTAVVFALFGPGLMAMAGTRPDLPLWKAGLHLLALGALLGVVRAGLQIDYVLEADQVARRRVLFGQETRWPVASFEEVAAVSVECRRHVTKSRSWLTYRLVLVRRDGELVPVSHSVRDPAAVTAQATRLAKYLGCAMVPGAEGRRLTIEPAEGKAPRIIQQEVEPYLLPQGNSPEVTMISLAVIVVAGGLAYGAAWSY